MLSISDEVPRPRFGDRIDLPGFAGDRNLQSGAPSTVHRCDPSTNRSISSAGNGWER